VAALQVRKQKLIDAVVDGRLKAPQFEEQLEKLELEVAKHSGQSENSDDAAEVGRLLSFGEWFLTNAATVWMGASSYKKRLIQDTVFPSGVTFSGDGFGTLGETSVFSRLATFSGDSEEMASRSAPKGLSRLTQGGHGR
jgi:hypothetical protein